MSPKGGIKPHNRFSVQSKRSEVLFVDYMAEHLTPSGRAGIIVPEGIIFQSQTAYKQLRKMLVEEYLVAVVSLPAGVFNPYSGVKTSILILDKSLAKQTRHHRLLQGRERRLRPRRPAPRDRQERPAAGAGRDQRIPAPPAGAGVRRRDFQPTLGLIVRKEKIAANGDYNLSGERYRESGAANCRDIRMVETRRSRRDVDVTEGTIIRTNVTGMPGRYPYHQSNRRSSDYRRDRQIRSSRSVLIGSSDWPAGVHSFGSDHISSSGRFASANTLTVLTASRILIAVTLSSCYRRSQRRIRRRRH